MENQEVKDVEEAIRHLEDILYVLRSNYQYRTSYAIELLINGYRELEEWKREEGCSLQEVHDLFIPKSKVEEKIEEIKIPNIIVGGRRNRKTLEYGKKLGKLEVLQELKEE